MNDTKAKTGVRIAHLELGMHLYGGAEQVRHLLTELNGGQHEHWLLTPEHSALCEWAQEAGQSVLPLRFAGEHDVTLIYRLSRWLRRKHITLLHVHSRRGADWMGALAGRLAGVPVILSRRVDNPPPRWLSLLMRRLYSRVICISDAIRKVVLASGVDADHVVTIRSAIDARRYQQPMVTDARRKLLGDDRDGPVLAVLAQLIERKGHRLLIEQLARLRDDFPHVQLVILGQGPLEESLRRLVDARGLTECVHFAGFREDLPALLGALSIVVHPALTEGLGVSLLQAGAAGLPIVAFAAGGVPEVVVHEHTGLLVTIGDGVALCGAIATLLADDALRNRMGDNARSHVEREFSIDALARRHEALYDVVAGETT